MRKVISLLLVMLLPLLWVGCGGEEAPKQQLDYAEVLRQARPEEENEAFPIVAGPEDDGYDLIFLEFGLQEEDLQRYAVSASIFMTHAYGIAIFMPAEGRQQMVLEAAEAFKARKEHDFENYLQDQYQIAKAAVIETADSGEILVAMCSDAQAVMDRLKQGLQG